MQGASAQAPKQIKIEFPSEGDRQVWIGDAKHPGDMKTPESAAGTSITLDAPAQGDGFVVYVHDKKTGNVAEKALPEVLKTSGWKVDPKEEKRVFQLVFELSSEGKPVASAVVRAKAGPETREALIGPSDKGKAVIYNLPTGPVEVTVQYKNEGSTKETPPQTFEAKLGAGPAVVKSLTISDKVETVADPVPATETKAKGEPVTKEVDKKPEVVIPPNPGVSALNLLIGLAVIGTLGYFVWNYVKKNPKQVEAMLKKAGLGDQARTQADPVPVTPAQPQPIKPIVLDASTPSAAVTPMATPGLVTAVANPRLVRSDGSVMLLADGANLVGRDDGLAVSLAGESSVSRQHARLDKTGDDVRLTDLGSTNGTFVNGARISTETLLRVGDSVQFGAVAFRFEA